MSRFLAFLFTSLLALSAAHAFAPGDTVRLTAGETLRFQGKSLQTGFKGQEFTVLRHDAFGPQVYVSYYKEDGSLIAATLPAKVLELAPPNAWSDLMRGAELFRDGRLDEAVRALARAGQDPTYRAYTQPLLPRITGALAAVRQGPAGRAGIATVGQGLRDLATTWAGQGMYSLAAAIDQGVDRLGAGVPPSKLDKADVQRRATESSRAVAHARQAVGFKRMVEASKALEAGREAEPEHPELKALAERVKKDLAEADGKFADADRMRRFPNGTPHALTALERGLKVCVDHTKLRALKKEMESLVEERTAPPVTPALLKAAKSAAPMPPLEEGRKLYTTRCTECHDLELLDSRSPTGWEKAVASMAGRANLTEAQKARIVEYLAVAWGSLEN